MSFIEDHAVSHVFLKATKFHKVGEVELPKYGLENNLLCCSILHSPRAQDVCLLLHVHYEFYGH